MSPDVDVVDINLTITAATDNTVTVSPSTNSITANQTTNSVTVGTLGLQGPQGPQGADGFVGSNGAQGPQGPQGATGPQYLHPQPEFCLSYLDGYAQLELLSVRHGCRFSW